MFNGRTNFLVTNMELLRFDILPDSIRNHHTEFVINRTNCNMPNVFFYVSYILNYFSHLTLKIFRYIFQVLV